MSCIACKKEKHPPYACPKFRALGHDDMASLLKANNLCLNCMRPGHYVRECTSYNRCKHCQKRHHTLLHIETGSEPSPAEASHWLSLTPLCGGCSFQCVIDDMLRVSRSSRWFHYGGQSSSRFGIVSILRI